MHALDNPTVLGDREQHVGELAIEHLYGCSAAAIRALAEEAEGSSAAAVRQRARRLARDLVRLRRGEIDIIEMPAGLPPDDEWILGGGASGDAGVTPHICLAPP